MVSRIKPEWGVETVRLAERDSLLGNPGILSRDLVGPATPLRHDSDKLADALATLVRPRRRAGQSRRLVAPGGRAGREDAA